LEKRDDKGEREGEEEGVVGVEEGKGKRGRGELKEGGICSVKLRR